MNETKCETNTKNGRRITETKTGNDKHKKTGYDQTIKKRKTKTNATDENAKPKNMENARWKTRTKSGRTYKEITNAGT